MVSKRRSFRISKKKYNRASKKKNSRRRSSYKKQTSGSGIRDWFKPKPKLTDTEKTVSAHYELLKQHQQQHPELYKQQEQEPLQLQPQRPLGPRPQNIRPRGF